MPSENSRSIKVRNATLLAADLAEMGRSEIGIFAENERSQMPDALRIGVVFSVGRHAVPDQFHLHSEKSRLQIHDISKFKIYLEIRCIVIYLDCMRNKHHNDGIGRHIEHAGAVPDADDDGHSGRHRRGRGRHRLFDYGELRLVILAMISHEPSHGYELIKAIEERFDGSYTPSPGVIYPTLSWLEDMGYAEAVADEGTRKRFQITAEGKSFLKANHSVLEDLHSRKMVGRGGRKNAPAPVLEAMGNLKTALRQRFRNGPVSAGDAEAIAAAINSAAQTVEKILSETTMTHFGAAEIATEHASRYLQQLCKHFQHKRPVTFDPQVGEISFSVGDCRLEATDAALKISLSSPGEEELTQLKDVVVRHLVRFAFREELSVVWQDS